MRRRLVLLTSAFAMGALLLGAPAFGQQTGSVSGVVTDQEGGILPGVTVEAAGSVLPTPRLTITNAQGRYDLRGLPPGEYVLTFTLEGLETVKRETRVLLDQNVRIDVTMQLAGVTETVNVVAEVAAIDPSSAELKAAIADDVIDLLPVGQDYKDLVKLIPGVQYSEDETRGPSAGGSGQDNVYLIDGVNVGLPLFGTLSAEPSSHDVDQISIIKGGAKAIDFNRSGGFTINSVSKSGTNQFQGELSYQIQTEGMTAERDTGSDAEFEQDEDWAVASLGGPVIKDRLNFYVSYFRPTEHRDSRSNSYGTVPDFESDRDEFFGKLTFTPTSSILLNASHRDSERDVSGDGVEGETTAGTLASGVDITLEITTVEGSWVNGQNGFASFKYTNYENTNTDRPDTVLGFDIASDGSVGLDVNNLDQQGRLVVPQPVDGADAFNDFIAPLIDRYGFLENGVRTGGGRVGAAATIDNQDFFREAYQVGYDYLWGIHDLHVGYQSSSVSEELSRVSNGWGIITVPGGRDTASDGTPIFYQAEFEQQGLRDQNNEISPVIDSEFESQSFEVNNTIRLSDWTFNVGVLLSNDELFGQGLRENSSNLSGFELAPGNQYKMYEVDFDEQISPRLGVTWSPNGADSVYASYSRYYPEASSLPRAASWARNLRRTVRGYFDAQGNLIETDPVSSSSGKFFADDLDPRSIDEFIIGYSRQINPRWSLKTHGRYRYGQNFWEDTNNTARLAFNPPPGIPQEPYIPELDAYRAEVGGSSYVIAELDGAFTKYYEASVETQWRGSNAYVQASYVWSHYYGNFDQDNTTTDNDDNIFIGSSFIADGAGRQLWNFREGNLRGDRRHQVKVYGSYAFDWNGTAGAYAVYQSGQPWEAWNVEVYRDLTGSTSDTSRYAEPAGSRTTDAHYQLDLNYTQNFKLAGRYNIQVRADVFNLFDNQTGYNIQNKVNSANFGEARSFFDPRRFQLGVAFQF